MPTVHAQESKSRGEIMAENEERIESKWVRCTLLSVWPFSLQFESQHRTSSAHKKENRIQEVIYVARLKKPRCVRIA